MSAEAEQASPGARLSIGEVVSLLRLEFSDLTDSKIRFLEDRKLISPGRTPGGYRSFGPHDIEVLRWILTRQRDQYLPLSIIGERIDRGEHLADIWGIGVDEAAGPRNAAVGEDAGSPGAAAGQAEPEATAEALAEAVAAEAPPAEAAADGRAADNADDAPALAPADSGGPPWLAPDDARSFTAAELSAESGLSVDQIAELTDFGLLAPLPSEEAELAESPGSEAEQASLGLEPPEARYGSDALLMARISREFATYGLHARHLRVIRNAAARDASMFEQGIQPILHAGGPSADLDAQRSLGRLVALCERLRSVVMGEALRRYWR